MCLIPAEPLENKPCGHPIALMNALYWADLNGVVLMKVPGISAVGFAANFAYPNLPTKTWACHPAIILRGLGAESTDEAGIDSWSGADREDRGPGAPRLLDQVRMARPGPCMTACGPRMLTSAGCAASSKRRIDTGDPNARLLLPA